jgi:hypothetical protein
MLNLTLTSPDVFINGYELTGVTDFLRHGNEIIGITQIIGDNFEGVINKICDLRHDSFLLSSDGTPFYYPQMYANILLNIYSIGDLEHFRNINHFSGEILNLNFGFRKTIVEFIIEGGYSKEEILCIPDSILLKYPFDPEGVKIFYLTDNLNNKISYNYLCMNVNK